MIGGNAYENGRYNPILARVMLKEAYEIETGLYNHDDPALDHPLQYHLMTEKKMIAPHGLFKLLTKRYHDAQINKYFGITLLDFLDLPIDKVDTLLEMALEYITDEDEARSKVEKSFSNQNMMKFDAGDI